MAAGSKLGIAIGEKTGVRITLKSSSIQEKKVVPAVRKNAMHTEVTKAALSAIAFAVLCGGCDFLKAGSGTAETATSTETTEYPIQTDQTEYLVRPISQGGLSGIEVAIPMRYTNTRKDRVYLIGCRRPSMPILERWDGKQWITAWAGGELLCLSPPWAVAPREVYRDTLHVQGFWPDQSILPEFQAPVEGTYRLVRSIYTEPDPSAPQLPEEDRRSNTFDLQWDAE